MTSAFEDPSVRAAMREYLAAADALDGAASDGGPARTLLDLAEAKAVAGMSLRKRLQDLGWSAPAAQRSAT